MYSVYFLTKSSVNIIIEKGKLYCNGRLRHVFGKGWSLKGVYSVESPQSINLNFVLFGFESTKVFESFISEW